MGERQHERSPHDGTHDERAKANGTTRKPIAQLAWLVGGVLAAMLVAWICDACGISSHTITRAVALIVIAVAILKILRKRQKP